MEIEACFTNQAILDTDANHKCLERDSDRDIEEPVTYTRRGNWLMEQNS